MKIAVCSMFRDSQRWCGVAINQVDKYFQQMAKDPLFDICDFYLYENNSLDNTKEILRLYADKYSNVYLTCDNWQVSSISAVESIASQTRIKYLSVMANTLLSNVNMSGKYYDYLLWIESDIIQDNIIQKLVSSNVNARAEILAPLPLINLNDEMLFYDTWGFTIRVGYGLQQTYPYFVEESNRDKQYVEMETVGTCALIKYSLIKSGLNFGGGAFRALCSRLNTISGSRIICDTTIKVYHPSTIEINGRYV